MATIVHWGVISEDQHGKLCITNFSVDAHGEAGHPAIMLMEAIIARLQGELEIFKRYSQDNTLQ